MRTTLDLDGKLIDELVRASGCASKKEAIETAARVYLHQSEVERMISNFGNIRIEPVYRKLRQLDRKVARRMAKRGLLK